MSIEHSWTISVNFQKSNFQKRYQMIKYFHFLQELHFKEETVQYVMEDWSQRVVFPWQQLIVNVFPGKPGEMVLFLLFLSF